MIIEHEIDEIIRREGGDKYTNHPSDRGGATKFGITQRTLDWAREENPILPEHIKEISRPQARFIYVNYFYLKLRINDLPEFIQPLMLDMCVNHGSGNAIKILQEVVNESLSAHLIKVDGLIGDITISGVGGYFFDRSPGDLYDAVLQKRKWFNVQIVRNDPSQAVFLDGWLNRCEEFG